MLKNIKSTLNKTWKNNYLLVAVIILIGLFFRLWHVDFGLPHYFHNDEAEIVELALTPSIRLKQTFIEGGYKNLEPNSYVYGTFSSYLLIPLLSVINQVGQFLGSTFVKADFYLAARIFTATLSSILILFTAKTYETLFKDKLGFYLALLLTALNWKLIVFSHFVNTDIYLTLLVSGMIFFLISYFQNKKAHLLYLSAIFFGLAVGTKITALISVPLILYIFISENKVKKFFVFTGISLLSFAISNPFSIINYNELLQRIVQMRTREAGVVFSSVNENPFKYVVALAFISTPLVFLSSIYGAAKSKINKYHIFLIGHVLLYVAVFSFGKRRTDRWLLPILPIAIIYASYGISKIKEHLNKQLYKLGLIVIILSYLYLPLLLLFQFRSQTPKSESYLWAKNNISESSTKLIITETGNSPYLQLDNSEVYDFNVYESRGAQNEYPPKTEGIDYVILASKPMTYFKKPYIKKTYPDYYQEWYMFEDKLKSNGFKLVKSFELPKPNIITLSDMYIYKNLEGGTNL